MPQPISLLDLTSKLIEFKTVTDNAAEIGRLLDFIENFFKETNLNIVKSESNGVKSLVVLKKTNTPKIFLCGHLDVVSADDEQFKPRVENGRLYGRGALDMKSGCAVLMRLMYEFAATDHDLGLMLTTDEETGGFHGTKHVLASGFKSEIAILPDGGLAPNRIVQKAKGVMWIKLTAKGQAAHASTPWRGENAIATLTESISKMQTLFAKHEKETADHWVTTCNLSQLHGGTTVNQVPDSASAICDIRYTENDKPQDILQNIQDAAGPMIQVEQMVCEPASFISDHEPALKQYQETARNLGLEPKLVREHGSSDARHFSALGIPVLMSQPLGGNHHGKDEWVDIESMEIYYRLIKSFIDKIARSS